MAARTHNSKDLQKAAGIANPPRRRLYDLKAAAAYLGRPIWGIRTLIWQGKLPVIQDGRKMYVDLYDMDRYIELEKTTFL
jgi:hypothetical protein